MSATKTPRVEPAHANIRRAWAPEEDGILQREAELQRMSLQDHQKDPSMMCIASFSANRKPQRLKAHCNEIASSDKQGLPETMEQDM